MDPTLHADDEMRAKGLVDQYRDKLVAQAKATMLARPGERICGMILDRTLPETVGVLAALPANQQPTTPEVVGVGPRAYAMHFMEQFNLAAGDWLPGDKHIGDQYQLPVIVALREGLQTFVVTFTP